MTEAPTEGIWVDVGELDYQVQLARQLTPAMAPDRSYLSGLPDGILPPSGRETWFAVFLRIENRTEEPHPTAREIEIVDTEEKVYRPLELDRDTNPFAYVPRDLPANSLIPEPDSAPSFSSAGGELLLFKLPIESFYNRPLELRIASADVEPREAIIDLDL